jgi:hypothetical protein
VIGYRLVAAGCYQPITPDEDGRILCETIGLWISLREGRLVMEEFQTGERLLTSAELEHQAEQEYQRAEQEYQRAEQERLRAEQERLRAEQEYQRAEQERLRAEKLADFLRHQGFDPDQL